MAFTEDLTAFFQTAEFAETVQLNGVDVVGIFDQAVTEGAPGTSSYAPIFTLPTASVPADPIGMTLTRVALTYKVTEHQPDGTGVSVLILARTS